MVIMTKNRIENHGSDNCDKKMVMMKTGIKFTIVIIMVIWVIGMLTRSIKKYNNDSKDEGNDESDSVRK